MAKIKAIEINFPVGVNVPDGFYELLSSTVGLVCKQYEKENPDRVMWAAGHGSKPTYIPMTQKEEQHRGMEFNDHIYEIEVAEREDIHNRNKNKLEEK